MEDDAKIAPQEIANATGIPVGVLLGKGTYGQQMLDAQMGLIEMLETQVKAIYYNVFQNFFHKHVRSWEDCQ